MAVLIFVILRIAPGDIAVLMAGGGSPDVQIDYAAIARIREELGLNDPIHVQFGRWLWEAARFDLGDSYWYRQPAGEMILARLPISLELAGMAVIIKLLIAIPGGILSAVHQDRWPDYVWRIFSIAGLSVPSFWVGLLVILLLVKYFGWSPPVLWTSFFDNPRENLSQIGFGALILGVSSSALILRLVRSSILEVMREDYIRTAHAKGLRQSVILIRHALRNAMLPVVTIIGIQTITLISGVVVIERVFNLPGLGNLLVAGVEHRDYPVVQAMVLYIGIVVIFINLAVDVAYAWLDPRIRYS